MSAVPEQVTLAILENELANCRPWAIRHGWQLRLEPETLTVDATNVHPADQRAIIARGVFNGYRALPPIWLFVDPESGQMALPAWPSPGPVQGQASIFHSFGVVCAHWSRKAYQELGGPHPNWGALTNWTQVREGVHAENLGEMLAAIDLYLQASPGRMAS